MGLPACPGSAWAAGSILQTLDVRCDSYDGAPPFFVESLFTLSDIRLNPEGRLPHGQ